MKEITEGCGESGQSCWLVTLCEFAFLKVFWIVISNCNITDFEVSTTASQSQFWQQKHFLFCIFLLYKSLQRNYSLNLKTLDLLVPSRVPLKFVRKHIFWIIDSKIKHARNKQKVYNDFELHLHKAAKVRNKCSKSPK